MQKLGPSPCQRRGAGGAYVYTLQGAAAFLSWADKSNYFSQAGRRNTLPAKAAANTFLLRRYFRFRSFYISSSITYFPTRC